MMRVTPMWLVSSVRRCERVVFAVPGLARRAPRRNAIVVLLYLFLLLVAVNVVYTLVAVAALSPAVIRLGDGAHWCFDTR